ncbi:MAG: hypothetical protein ACMX3H_00770 [Sodalis sp. (in: enterobacteria)]|uniref:hypothetical protein n=1 Tax=Sodalis sp. (in: enterobacteria) TaxID=1898979 RepID=UPI0039E6BE51
MTITLWRGRMLSLLLAGRWAVGRCAASRYLIAAIGFFLIAVIYLNRGNKSPTQTFSFSVRIRREPADRANDQGIHA